MDKHIKRIDNKNNILCSFDCGSIAKYQYPKSGNYCCGDNWRKCPNKKTIKLFNKKEKEHLDKNKHLLKELDGSELDIKNKFLAKSRKILITCEECNVIREMTITDFLNCVTNFCNSCAKKGDRNVSKRADVREKLSRKGVKDTSYATIEWRKAFSKKRKGKGNPMYGRKDSLETRRKKRLASIKILEQKIKNGGQFSPGYNIQACKLIEEYGKKHNYNFQHAENGGEFRIKELGYWVDGYDKEKNIVLEVDESFHFNVEGNLKERDIQRQKEITEFLKCKFIRIKI